MLGWGGGRDEPLNGFVIFIVCRLIMDESLPWQEIRLNLEPPLAHFLLLASCLSKCVKTVGQWDSADVCQHNRKGFWSALQRFNHRHIPTENGPQFVNRQTFLPTLRAWQVSVCPNTRHQNICWLTFVLLVVKYPPRLQNRSVPHDC